MITYKFHADPSALNELNREFMSAIRMSYQIWQQMPDHSLSQMASQIKQIAWDHLDVSLVQMAVNQAKHLRGRAQVMFGSRKWFDRLKWHKGDRDKNLQAWKSSRNYGMLLRGSVSDSHGNRKATLDIQNHQVLIKPKKGTVVPIKLVMSSRLYRYMMRLQLACESHEAYFNIQIGADHVCISFDEQVIADKIIQQAIKGRILSIDSNPNYLGVVIADEHKIIHKEVIDLYDLNHKHVKSAKKKHEKHQAVKHIMSLARHYQCESIAVEQLHMLGKDHKKGRTFNRLVNNTWHKNLIHNSLKKWCVIHHIKFTPVIAAYSSFVGCIQNPGEFDSVAAAIEINKRARLALKRQKYDLLPKNFDPELIPTLWKEMGLATLLANGITSWRQLYEWCSRTKFSYRVGYKRGLYGDIRSCSLYSPASRMQVVHMHASQVVDSCNRA